MPNRIEEKTAAKGRAPNVREIARAAREETIPVVKKEYLYFS
tara:strand:+ start:1033 stop:1158 length:126 start_codon:yes stop_codon:yes gene_type:complete